MAKILGVYKNGNYFVEIYEDGTKIRSCAEDQLKPEFPECIDLTITKKCDGKCPYCYMGCTEEGEHGDWLKFYNIINQVRPYTELAINVNDLSFPALRGFLGDCKDRNIIVNITINQKHFMKNVDYLLYLEKHGLFKGIGISFICPKEGFIEAVKKFKNPVIHTIAGILLMSDIVYLKDNGLKILVLGYKKNGRGKEYYEENKSGIDTYIDLLANRLPILFNSFEVVSFDNLALEQLHLKEKFTEKEWERIYMGDEGQFTFYIDLVNGTFARSSMDEEEFPMMNTVEEMFQFIRTKYGVK